MAIVFIYNCSIVYSNVSGSEIVPNQQPLSNPSWWQTNEWHLKLSLTCATSIPWNVASGESGWCYGNCTGNQYDKCSTGSQMHQKVFKWTPNDISIGGMTSWSCFWDQPKLSWNWAINSFYASCHSAAAPPQADPAARVAWTNRFAYPRIRASCKCKLPHDSSL